MMAPQRPSRSWPADRGMRGRISLPPESVVLLQAYYDSPPRVGWPVRHVPILPDVRANPSLLTVRTVASLPPGGRPTRARAGASLDPPVCLPAEIAQELAIVYE